MKKRYASTEINGIPVSPGTVMASVCHFQSQSLEQTAIFKIEPDQIEGELQRLNNAIEISKIEINHLAKNIEKNIGKNEAKIFETHILLLEDDQLLKKIHNIIKNKNLNIEYAVKTVFEEYEELFAKMDDEYMKDRGTDFSELKRRILSHLTGKKGKFICDSSCNISDENNNRIVITKELTTSMMSLVKDNNIIGFITQNGGKSSHAAILTRAAGVSYITGIDKVENIECGTFAIIDNNSGKIILNPSDKTKEKYKNIINKENELSSSLYKDIGPIVKTKDGIDIELYANIINLEEMQYMDKFQFAGIGLVRTEFLFFDDRNFPNMNEQEKTYSELIKKSKDKPVTFRLFDLGGDKKIKSIEFLKEENPLLGLRGIRFLMKNRNILEDQINAICKAHKNSKTKILYPMISNLIELKEANLIVKNILKKHNLLGKIEIGMMFEVPSVFIDPKPFLEEVDFISIGTNDLAQYLFGIDRNNVYVDHLYNQDDPIIHKLIKDLVIEAKKQNIDVSLCGEINYDTRFVENMIDIGINKFSMTPVGVPNFIKRISK